MWPYSRCRCGRAIQCPYQPADPPVVCHTQVLCRECCHSVMHVMMKNIVLYTGIVQVLWSAVPCPLVSLGVFLLTCSTQHTAGLHRGALFHMSVRCWGLCQSMVSPGVILKGHSCMLVAVFKGSQLSCAFCKRAACLGWPGGWLLSPVLVSAV